MKLDSLEDAAAEIRALVTRIKRLETAAPIGHSSVSRGALRIASAEGLIVEGSARISGVLDGNGTLHWTGTVKFDGPVQIVGNVTRSGNETATGTTTLNGTTYLNGPTNITGATDITGTLDVSGVTTVTNDLNVTGGGEINAGAVTITPASGGQVRAGSTTLASNGRMSSSTGTNIISNALVIEGQLSQSLGPVVFSDLPSISSPAAGSGPIWATSGGALFHYTGA